MDFRPLFRDLGRTLLYALPEGIIFALIIISAAIIIKRKSLKSFFSVFVRKMKSRKYILIFIFLVYLFIILYRTLFSRSNDYEPLASVFEGWITTTNGYNEVNYEVIGNIGMFIPFSFLLLSAFGNNFSMKKAIYYSVIASFSLSAFIELNQLIFKCGTFQISDLVYNTLGGILGSLIFVLTVKIRNKKRRKPNK